MRSSPATSRLYRFLSSTLDVIEFVLHCIVVGFQATFFIMGTVIGVVAAVALAGMGLYLIAATVHFLLHGIR